MIEPISSVAASPPRAYSALLSGLVATIVGLALHAAALGDVLFTDDFSAGASALWGDEIGAWSAADGVYRATLPSNAPPTVTSLPFPLRDFTIDVDINDIQDGGLWLRTEFDTVTGVARNGVLLVTGGDVGTYSGFYWHTFQNGAYSAPLEPSGEGLFDIGVSDVTLRVEVIGSTYSVFLDDDPLPATTLTTDLRCDGRVGLYDFSNQTFDNFVLTGISAGCPEDLDCDGQVNVNDLLLLLAAWGETSGRPDVNGDGIVDVSDLLEVLGAWGPCP
jgi:hypothetical protein